MKLKVQTKDETGQVLLVRDHPAVRFVAVIGKSKKLNIPRRYQKTFTLVTVAPELVSNEMRSSVEKQAQRWEQKILQSIREPHEEKTYSTGSLL